MIPPQAREVDGALLHSYDDGGTNLALCVEVQNYYARDYYKTKVKAAGLLSISETKKLANVASMTVAPDLLHKLAQRKEREAEASRDSICDRREEQSVNEKKEGLENSVT